MGQFPRRAHLCEEVQDDHDGCEAGGAGEKTRAITVQHGEDGVAVDAQPADVGDEGGCQGAETTQERPGNAHVQPKAEVQGQGNIVARCPADGSQDHDNHGHEQGRVQHGGVAPSHGDGLECVGGRPLC